MEKEFDVSIVHGPECIEFDPLLPKKKNWRCLLCEAEGCIEALSETSDDAIVGMILEAHNEQFEDGCFAEKSDIELKDFSQSLN